MAGEQNLEDLVPRVSYRLPWPLLLQLGAVRELLGVRAISGLAAVSEVLVELLLVDQVVKTARTVEFWVLVDAIEVLLETTDVAEDTA